MISKTDLYSLIEFSDKEIAEFNYYLNRNVIEIPKASLNGDCAN